MGGSSKRVTVGYRYFMGLHFGICYGPVDRLLRILVGDRLAWIGSAESNQSISISAPRLFGGDEREGGIVGTGEVMMGGSAQTLPASVAAALPSPSPAFRGILSLFYDGQISANNPYVKPFAFTLTRILQGWHGGAAWYPEKAPVPIFAAGQSESTLAGFRAAVHFSYTGANQTWTVPEGVTSITVKAWGGGGHGGLRGTTRPALDGAPTTYGGGAGYSSATFEVTPGQVLTIRVGGGGRNLEGSFDYSRGGWPNGARGGIRDNGAVGGGGGGDSRVTGTGVLIVAGGGGGGGSDDSAGYPGGGLSGGGATHTGLDDGVIGGGAGTQSAAGAAGNDGIPGAGDSDGTAGSGSDGGVGANGTSGGSPPYKSGGGGGGGYFGGGGGGGTSLDDGGGGGGSGYVPVGGVTQAGSGSTPGGAADAEYSGGWGRGGYGWEEGGVGHVIIGTTAQIEAMNPAHIIYQCLTDPQWGMGYPAASIDVGSFTAAADTLYAEGFGLCMLWNQQEELGAFVRTVLDHAGAILYTDPQTGHFALKLIRGDYTPAALPIFDETNVGALESFQRVGYGDLVNEITVVYRDAFTNKDTPITVQNLAAIQAQGGVVSKTVQYPGLPVASLAARVAQRDLIASSTPLAKARITVNRRAWSLYPGEVLKLSWSKLGLDEVIFRVLAIDYGSLNDGMLSIEIAEDVFGLPASSYIAQEPAGWEEPDTSPALITVQQLVEVPYYSLVAEVGQADADALDVDAAFFGAVASRPSDLSLSFDVYSRVGVAAFEQEAVGGFVPSATLGGAITRQATAITLADAVDLDEVELDSLAIIGTGRAAEWVLVTAVDTLAGTITVSRGVLDTTPAEHADGAPIFFSDARDAYDPTERATTETVDAKLATVSTGGTLDYNAATTISATADQRQARPYAPGNVLINGEAFPTLIEEALTITWAHRDRRQQTAGIITQTDGNIGPEAGTTYSAFAYDDDTDALITSSTGISGTSWAPAIADSHRLRIEIEAVRGGLESWQRQVRVFDYVGEDGRATEASELRTTEAGEIRAQE